ncbi:unnamed protein product, partial [Iphiclides podalirius]
MKEFAVSQHRVSRRRRYGDVTSQRKCCSQFRISRCSHRKPEPGIVTSSCLPPPPSPCTPPKPPFPSNLSGVVKRLGP